MATTLLSTDALDVALDPASGDLYFDEDGGSPLTSGIDGVAQLIRIRIQLFKGEWFVNLDAGVPWFQEILGEKYDEAKLRRRLSEAILEVPAVEEILSLEVSFDASTRYLTVDYEVRTKFGDTVADTLEV